MPLSSEMLELLTNKKNNDEVVENIIKLTIQGSRFHPKTKQWIVDLLPELKKNRPKIYQNITNWLGLSI